MKTSQIWALSMLSLLLMVRLLRLLLLLPLAATAAAISRLLPTGSPEVQPDVSCSYHRWPRLHMHVAEESVRERQLMAAAAGPSDAGGEGEEEEYEELQEPPFPEPQVQPMLLCDLLELAAEADTASLVRDSE